MGTPNPRLVDLDQARSARTARAEALKQPVVLKLDGKQFTLPAEMPVDFALYCDAGALRPAIFALLGDEEAEAFFALRPSVDDVAELVDQVTEAYEVKPGEEQASPGS